MGTRLRPEDVVTIVVLQERGTPKRAIARTLGVTEGAVRYHLRRKAAGAKDRRRFKHFKAEQLEAVIRAWVVASSDVDRPPNVKDLYEFLIEQHEYKGSYKSVLRFVRGRFPQPKMRTYRRVETPAGAQTQTDWGEFPAVDVGDGPEPLCAFVMVLSHCRMVAVVWSRSHDLVNWLRCHNEAYRRLGGIAAVNRIDNVKTAISNGAGAFGTIHPTYRAYARSVGFHVDACQPREANAKGKTEAKVRLTRLLIDVARARYSSLDELQAATDQKIATWSRTAICPATGTTVHEAWQAEIPHLRELPALPEPFDVAVLRPVHRDCVVHFEGRQYAVPFVHAGTTVEVRGCAQVVQILHDGRVVRVYPRGTAERILIDPDCYEGEATDRVVPPPPLGRMGKKLQEILDTPVEKRPVDLYAALMEVAR